MHIEQHTSCSHRLGISRQTAKYLYAHSVRSHLVIKRRVVILFTWQIGDGLMMSCCTNRQLSLSFHTSVIHWGVIQLIASSDLVPHYWGFILILTESSSCKEVVVARADTTSHFCYASIDQLSTILHIFKYVEHSLYVRDADFNKVGQTSIFV